MFKPPMLTAMMVFDVASRPTNREGAEPSDLRQLGHDAYVPRRAAVVNHDSGPSISRIPAVVLHVVPYVIQSEDEGFPSELRLLIVLVANALIQ
jgi:hypothetical protein